MSQKRIGAYLFLLIASIIWGIAGPVIKYTLTDFPPLIFLTYRFALSTIIGIFFLALTRPQLPKKANDILMVLIASFLTTTVTLGLLFFGFEHTTSISGNIISAIGPLLLVFLGALYFKEHITRTEKIGVSIAFIGTLISVVEPVLAAGPNTMTSTIYGNLLVFLSLVVNVVSILLVKKVLRSTVSAQTLTHLMFIVGFITITPLTIHFHNSTDIVVETILHAPLSAHLGVWYMALLSGTFAYILHFKGLRTIEVGEASIFTYLSPIWGAPFSFFWLGEQITVPFIIGSILIAVGVVIAEYKRSTKSKLRSKRRRRR